MSKGKRRRSSATEAEQLLGVRGTTAAGNAKAFDFFSNLAARTGYGTPSLTEGTQYELVRLSYNYWELITLYRNHWITRRIVDMPAQDMVRAWPKLTSDLEPKDVTKIDKVLRRTNTKNSVLRAMQWARLFGGAGGLIVIDGQEDQLDQPIDLEKIELGAYRGVIPFDRWVGIQPSGDVCTDINRPLEFNKPESYRINSPGAESFNVHASRILRFTGPPVPTPEYEAQTWWGISVIEPVYEEIRKRDNMSWNILSLSYRANILGMKIPDLATLMSGLGSNQKATQKFAQRMSEINHLMSNQSLIPLPVDGGIESTQYSFSGLSECYQQFQLDISGAAQIPVTRLWGRTISGLGQSNDADERIYEEKIAADQDQDMRPQLEQLYPVICMSELGEVPNDLDLDFPSVRVLDEKEKSELAKAVVDTVSVAVQGGFASPRVAGKELKQSSTATGIFTNITDEDIEALSDKVQPEGELGGGLFGEEGAEQLDPAENPQKVIREEAKEKKAEPKPKAKGKATDGAEGVPASVKGMRLYHALPVTVETERGGLRQGKGWEVSMPADYGYINDVIGADGDMLDCYIGPSPESSNVYVVDQDKVNGRGFDEHKVMLGYHTAASAVEDYMAGHSHSQRVFAGVTAFTMPMFRRWVATADLRLPCSRDWGRAYDAENFKEAEHPRDKDGKFSETAGGGSAPKLPKGMEHVTKGAHKSAASLTKALISENKYTSEQVKDTVNALMGSKLTNHSINYYKQKLQEATPEGKAAAAAKKAAVAANDTAIKKAASKPIDTAKMNAALDKAEQAGYKTFFVKALDSKNDVVYFKVGGVPDGVEGNDFTAALKKEHKLFSVMLAVPYSAGKPQPPNVKPVTLTPEQASSAKEAAYAKVKAAAEAKSKMEAANKPFTETEETLSKGMQQAIHHYTNGSYTVLNSNLRNGRPLESAHAELAAMLDQVLAKSKTTETVTVYRGITQPEKFFGPTPKIGTVILDNGFVSTSKSPHVASGFGSAMVAKITVPKGRRAIDVSKLSLHSNEKEVLLPRGSMFKITNIIGNTVECEYVSQ